MDKRIILLILIIAPMPAYASYRDGFFGFLIVFIAAPVLIIGTFFTIKYYYKHWFTDRTFTIFYTVLWLLITAVSITVASLYSIDGGDKESPTIIFWGFSLYYIIIVLPAIIQYKKRNTGV